MQDIRENLPHPARVWIGFVGSPIIWMVQFILIWALSEGGCFIGLNARAIQLAGMAISLVALALVGASGWIAYHNAVLSAGNATSSDDLEARARERTRFMALVGIGFCAIFAAVIVLTMLPIFVLPTCDV